MKSFNVIDPCLGKGEPVRHPSEQLTGMHHLLTPTWSVMFGRLVGIPRIRITRKRRLVAVAHLSVDTSAGRHFRVEIFARGAVLRQIQRFAAGDRLRVTGKISHLRWTNKHDQPGERWTMAAETIERIPYQGTGVIELKPVQLCTTRGQSGYVQGELDLRDGGHP